MNKRTDIVTGTLNVDKAFGNLFGLRRPTKATILEALREMIHNAVDAKATIVDIVLRDDGTVLVLDDGEGFLEKHRTGYFDLYQSHKTGERGQTGQHGTGRVRVMTFCTEQFVYSVSQDRPEGISTSLTGDKLKTLFSKHEIRGEWKRGDLRPNWWHLQNGKSGSGIKLTLAPEFVKLFPKPAVLIAELGNYLKLSVAEKVRVNGKKLADRGIVGQAIRRTFTFDELGDDLYAALGNVEVELFIPERKGPDEEVRIGGDHPICSLADFVKLVDERGLTGPIPDLLTRRVLIGDIFFEKLNRHCAEDRRSLKDSVIRENVHVHLIRFLAGVLGPVIEECYAKHESDAIRAERTEMLHNFVDAMNRATGFDPASADFDSTEPSGKTPTAPPKAPKANGNERMIVVNRRRVELCPGDSMTLRVIKPRESSLTQHLEWVVASENDTLLCRGSTCVYLAEKLGTHVIRVRDTRSPDVGVDITIKVTATKKVVITPSNPDIERGGSEKFTVRNNPSGGRLQWEITTKDGNRAVGLRLSQREGSSTTLQVTDRAPIGEYVLKVCDKDIAGIGAETTVTVKQLLPPNLMRLDEAYYEVSAAVSQQPEAVRLTQDDVFYGEQRIGTITVNYDHADFRHGQQLGGTKATNLLLFEHVIVAHIHAEMEGNRISSPEEGLAKINDMRSRALGALVANK